MIEIGISLFKFKTALFSEKLGRLSLLFCASVSVGRLKFVSYCGRDWVSSDSGQINNTRGPEELQYLLEEDRLACKGVSARLKSLLFQLLVIVRCQQADVRFLSIFCVVFEELSDGQSRLDSVHDRHGVVH